MINARIFWAYLIITKCNQLWENKRDEDWYVYHVVFQHRYSYLRKREQITSSPNLDSFMQHYYCYAFCNIQWPHVIYNDTYIHYNATILHFISCIYALSSRSLREIHSWDIRLFIHVCARVRSRGSASVHRWCLRVREWIFPREIFRTKRN